VWIALIFKVIHWGPPSDIEDYIQETGRARRNGNTSHAILYYSNKDLGYTFVEDGIKDYCHNTIECRRHNLFSKFDVYDMYGSSKPKGCDVGNTLPTSTDAMSTLLVVSSNFPLSILFLTANT